jgi:hypothetical protein
MPVVAGRDERKEKVARNEHAPRLSPSCTSAYIFPVNVNSEHLPGTETLSRSWFSNIREVFTFLTLSRSCVSFTMWMLGLNFDGTPGCNNQAYREQNSVQTPQEEYIRKVPSRVLCTGRISNS